MKADTLILGRVATLNPHEPFKEAVACNDGKIMYVGSEEVARSLCDTNTHVLDYKGAYIYPGFADAHCHGGGAAIFLQIANLHPGKNMEDYQAILKKYAEANMDKKWIMGTGMTIGSDRPTHEAVDIVSTERPIMAQTGDGHSILLNKKAMEVLQIDADFAAKYPAGLVVLDAEGHPTGWINEAPAMMLYSKVNAENPNFVKEGLLKWQELAFSLGLTAVADALIVPDSNRAYCELVQEGKWHLRTYGAYNVNRTEDFVAAADKIAEAAKKSNSEYFTIRGTKMFLDGVVEQHTAWLLDDYTDEPGNQGTKLVTDKDAVVAMIKRCGELGLNCHFHAIGDGAVHMAVDCIKQAQEATGNFSMRNEIAHIQLATPKDVALMGDLDIIAIVAPLWATNAPGNYELNLAYLGEERTNAQYPFKSFLNNDAVLAFHSDFPVSQKLGTARSLYMASMRCEPELDISHQLNADECLSRLEALSGISYGCFYAFGQETRQGWIEPGFLANMTVYDTDFLYADIDKVADAKLVATIVDGNPVYTA